MYRQGRRETAGPVHVGGQLGGGQELLLMEGGPQTPPQFPHSNRPGVPNQGPVSELAATPWPIRPSKPYDPSRSVRVAEC
jgi:hypothetical protein